MLILNFLVSAAYGVPAGNGNAYYYYEGQHSVHPEIYRDEPRWQIRDTIPIVIWFPAVVVLGLLADVTCGRKRMVVFGIVLLWVVLIVDCVRVMLFYYGPDYPHKTEFFHAVFIIDAVLSYIATAAVLVNLLQLAIEQLTDASAEQVSSFIQWFMFTYFLGAWVFNQLQITQDQPLYLCFPLGIEPKAIKVLTSLVQVVFATTALCLMIVCGRWVTDIPVRDNPLKLMWEVLRFAAKHKYPVYRSALTYWEDDIPSRINLGKDKYGGPFTNEQVENVKTFFRMVCLGIPCFATATSSFLIDNNFVFSVSQRSGTNTLVDFKYYHNGTLVSDLCHRSLYAAFLANMGLWICVYVLLNEFVIYPLVKRCLPSMLKRIGLAFFLTIPESILLLLANIVALFTPSMTVHRLAVCCFITAIGGLQFYVVISSFLEFTCAQAPQSMKGFLIGFMWFMTIFLVVLSYFVYYVWSTRCTMHGCGTGYFFLTTSLSITGFILYCVVAKWYKHRERDECFNNQAIVEEVFARRLANKQLEESSSDYFE